MTDIIAVVACTPTGVISTESGELPWLLHNDLRHFKKVTMSQVCICGSKTYDSLGSRPLAGRRFAVLTSKVYPEVENVTFHRSIEELLEYYKEEEKLMVIGGGEVYASMLDMCTSVCLTTVYKDVPNPGAYFPIQELLDNFAAVDQTLRKTEGDTDYRFSMWAKKELLDIYR